MSNANQGHHDLGALEHDVDTSRARFDRSLSELARRLAPAGLADEVLGLMGVEGADNMRAGLRSLVREHPIPLLLIGGGIGLLAWEFRRRSAMQETEIDWYEAAGVREEPILPGEDF